MGIKNLNTFLRKTCPHIFHGQQSLEQFCFERVAVDTAIYICKFKTTYGKNWLDAFLLLISVLRENDIHPIFIFDTTFPPEKNEERKMRQAARQKNKDRVMRLAEEWSTFRDRLLQDFLKEEEKTRQASEEARELFEESVTDKMPVENSEDFRIVPDIFFSIFHPDLPLSIREIIQKQLDNMQGSLVFDIMNRYEDSKGLSRSGSQGIASIKERNKISLRSMDHMMDSVMNSLLSVTPQDFDLVKHLLQTLRIPFFQAIGEAEATCSWLCRQGLVKAVLSEDTDVLAYGAPMFIHKVNLHDGTCTIVKHDEVMQALAISPSCFLDFCILCGTDYNKNIAKVGPEKAFRLLKQYGNLETMEEKCPQLEVSSIPYVRIREIFTESHHFYSEMPLALFPDVPAVTRFCFENNCRFPLQRLFHSLFYSKRITFKPSACPARGESSAVDMTTRMFYPSCSKVRPLLVVPQNTSPLPETDYVSDHIIVTTTV